MDSLTPENSPENVNTLTELRNANARLTAEIQELRNAAASNESWWKSKPMIAGLTTMLAAIVPLTTAIEGCEQKKREVTLEEMKQVQSIAMQKERQIEDIRTAYLVRMKEPGEHLRTLRFVLATTKDESLKAWALQEKAFVEEELKHLDRRIENIERASPKSKTDESELEQLRIQRVRGAGSN